MDREYSPKPARHNTARKKIMPESKKRSAQEMKSETMPEPKKLRVEEEEKEQVPDCGSETEDDCGSETENDEGEVGSNSYYLIAQTLHHLMGCDMGNPNFGSVAKNIHRLFDIDVAGLLEGVGQEPFKFIKLHKMWKNFPPKNSLYEQIDKGWHRACDAADDFHAEEKEMLEALATEAAERETDEDHVENIRELFARLRAEIEDARAKEIL